MKNKQSEYQYFSRELSWLSFNERVLNEATDPSLTVNERLKFLAIYASNLSEFLKVKVAGIRILAEKETTDSKHSLILEDINQEVNRQQKRFYTVFERNILPELRDLGMGVGKYYNYDEDTKYFAENFFKEHLYGKLSPIILSNTSLDPYVQDNKIYVSVQLFKIKKDGHAGKKPFYGYVDVPTSELGRFVIHEGDDRTHVLLLEDIIRHNISQMFPGYEAKSTHIFTLLRDADIEIEDEYHGDLIQKIKDAIQKRKTGIPCRFSYESSMPLKMLMAFQTRLNLSSEDLNLSYGYPCFEDFMAYPKVPTNVSKEVVVPSSTLNIRESLLPQIEERDHLLHFPYQSYNYVLQFLNEVAINPQVYEIMTTQYRVANDSAVVNALINAVRNGKKVTVFVEAKARFDEERNLFFAEKMERAGVNIIYSMPNIKVHAKIILVNSKTKSDVFKSYAFVSTGNFNEKTAEIYTDHGLFTVDSEICSDLTTLFEMVGRSEIKNLPFKCIINSPFNTRKKIIAAIDREIQLANEGKDAHLIFKMNGLQDKETIDKLYEASLAGVKIELIVRGICCLKTKQPYSLNIRHIRIVDKFLEHGRIYWFNNGGNPQVIIGSADIMQRNLDKRIEVLIPIKNEELAGVLYDMLQIFLSDNVKACSVDEFMKNKKIQPGDNDLVRAQLAIPKLLMNLI